VQNHVAGGDDWDRKCLLECYAVCSGRHIPTFRNVPPLSTGMIMGMAGSYKKYVPGRYQTTRQHVLVNSYFDDAAEHDVQVNGGNGY
jgi:hypothetical protein